MKSFQIKAITFDLDGTLVDSKLDFDLMRKDAGIPLGEPILEYLEKSTDLAFKLRAMEIIHQHELRGMEDADIIRDAHEFLTHLKSQNLPIAILTRNSKQITEETLIKFGWKFDYVLTRDCAPAKPAPDGLYEIAQRFNVNLNHMLYIGDHRFDLQTAKNAGCIAGLIKQHYNLHLSHESDITIEYFRELLPYFG